MGFGFFVAFCTYGEVTDLKLVFFVIFKKQNLIFLPLWTRFLEKQTHSYYQKFQHLSTDSYIGASADCPDTARKIHLILVRTSDLKEQAILTISNPTKWVVSNNYCKRPFFKKAI